ncbi:carboxymuconolactone decarboxylase family protein [Paracoccus sp. PAR01]|uniref:carboxymuconolactone decarboxylase family protein n=1 Tax=Paracoccus sp. PAR01 TaxID=2769282 RepID=UPI001CE0E109|nr:carboxymuconolactone decarboxylase family protein [Paracoccus sp. PAR01]
MCFEELAARAKTIVADKGPILRIATTSAIRTDLIPATLAKFSPSDLPLDMHIGQFLSSIVAGLLVRIAADDPVMQLAQGAEGLSEPLATIARHVDLVTVTPEQYEVLAVMPSAKRVSEHLLMLAHEPESCLARTFLFNAIMYPEDRLDRADLELGALGTSLVNGCKYRAAVHARRHADLSKAPSRSARLARPVGCAAVPITLAMAVPVFACSRLLGSTSPIPIPTRSRPARADDRLQGRAQGGPMVVLFFLFYSDCGKRLSSWPVLSALTSMAISRRTG